MPWQRASLVLKLFENLLYLFIWALAFFYVTQLQQEDKVDGFYIITPALLACALNCFCIKYEETPCNATIYLMTKIVLVLRLLITFSVMLKVDNKAEWDWSTTFWPYWCSFAIQGIMGIASLIIFLNTVLNYLKEESTKADSKY